MENAKAKNVIIVVLLILVILTLGVIVYELVTGKTVKDLFYKTKAEVVENTEVQGTKKESVDKEVAEKYIEYIPVNIMYDKNSYQSKLVTYKNVPNEVLLAQAFLHIDKNKTVAYEKDGISGFTFERSAMQYAVKKIYGDEIVLENGELIYLDAAKKCYYNKEEGTYSYTVGGSGYIAPENITKFVSAEKDENNMYIYQKYMLTQLVYKDDELDDYKVILYKDSTKTEVLKELSRGEININYQKKEDYIHNLENILDKYEGDEQLYKHTFKKNTNGEYYWYSTEPVK